MNEPVNLTEKYGFGLMWYKGKYWKIDPYTANSLIDLKDSSKGITINEPEKAYICMDEEQYKAVKCFIEEPPKKEIPGYHINIEKRIHSVVARLRNPYGHNMEEIREDAVNIIEELYKLLEDVLNEKPKAKP